MADVEYLIVGGGGGGGGDSSISAGGGGGGRVVSGIADLGVGTYPITIAAGGTGQDRFSLGGTNGGSSSFNGVTAPGGGHGSGGLGVDGNSAQGSGGGGSPNSGAGGASTGTTGLGNNGGAGSSTLTGFGGGGGGATSVGSTGDSGGGGGTGQTSLISGASVSYGAGGNSIVRSSGVGANGTNGLGDGGQAGSVSTADAGPVGGRGGDGVVIIRYATADLTATGGVITTDGADTIHTFDRGGTGTGTFEITSVSGGGGVAPTITTPATANVDEGAALSIALIATGDPVDTWSISGGVDQAQFEISGATLRWVGNGSQDFGNPQDADTNNTYIVEVTATNATGSDSQTITVTVDNVVIQPTITTSATASVPEAAQLAIALTATGDPVDTWSITGGADQAQFEITGTTLRWTGDGTQDFDSPQDANTDNDYIIEITAANAGGSDVQTITVTVTEVAAPTPVRLGAWEGGAVSILPGTTWAAPNGMFPTEARNDDDVYALNAATSTITLPGSELADGYLLVAAFEFEDDSNGRCNPQARLTLSSGSGNFVAGASSGYNRDNSEDRSYCRCWAFIDTPSAGAQVQFQWRRDTDTPTGGTERASLQIIPLYYSNHGLYSSVSTACPGNTTVSQVTGWSAVDESDDAAIELVGNVVTMKGENKRYLCLGSQYWQGIGAARTQRWHGFRIDGTLDNAARAYSYARNGANADIGELFTTIVEREDTNRTLDQIVFRGEPIGAFPNTGADVAGNTTGSNPAHAMVVLELHDNAEVFLSRTATQQDIDQAGVRVDLNIADTVDLNDNASFTAESATAINAEQAGDFLLGANVSGGYATTSTARYTGYAEFTINGAGQAETFAGDYGRGNQGTQDTWGWSANLLGFVAAAANDNLGVDAGKITGGEGGTVDALAGWTGFWGINLATLQAASNPPPSDPAIYVGAAGLDTIVVGPTPFSELYLGVT